MHITRLLLTLAFATTITMYATAQDKSVRPGINDTFVNPSAKEFVERFEIESREVFAKRAEIVKACKIKQGTTIADIGAGTGIFTRMFSEAVGPEGHVIAVDIAQNFLDHINEKGRALGQKNVQTLLCTADSTGLMPGSVDMAYICDTYHHFEFPFKTLKSLHAALKPNGRVILIDFKRVEGEATDWTMKHVRAGQEVFEKEIIDSGFEKITEHKDALKENYFVEFKKADTRK